MDSLDFDLDSRMSSLESEWRQAYETSNAARAELLALATVATSSASIIAKAQLRLERAEGLKARIMEKIERFEDSVLRQG